MGRGWLHARRAACRDAHHRGPGRDRDPVVFGAAEKARDATAKSSARTAAGATEVYATDHDGSYVGANPQALHVIEASALSRGWYSTGSVPRSGSSCVGSPTFTGTFLTSAPVLTPPPSNTQLSTIPGVLHRPGPHLPERLDMKVSSSSSTCASGILYSGAIPSSGVVYVANGACSSPYALHRQRSLLLDVRHRVRPRFYSGQLTIAAENDIIVNGNVVHTGDGLLGLIANNFVRVYHPVPGETSKGSCGSNTDSGSLTNPQIEAAINHSFIVDRYDCGTTHGTLTVNGAIAQKYRGAVGTFSGSTSLTGYESYNYDDRLRYEEPPHFLDPVQVAWHVQRETLDFP